MSSQLVVASPQAVLRGFQMPMKSRQKFIFGEPIGNRSIDLDALLRTSRAPIRGKKKGEDYLLEQIIRELDPKTARSRFLCLLDIVALLNQYPRLSQSRQQELAPHTWYALAGTTSTQTNEGILLDVPFFEIIMSQPRVKFTSVTIPIGDQGRLFQFSN